MASLLLCLGLGVSCAPKRSFDASLSAIVRPYRFSIAQWEFSTLLGEIRALFQRDKDIEAETDKVTQYFSLVDRSQALQREIEATKTGNSPGDLAVLEAELRELTQQRSSTEEAIERIIAGQIRETLAQQGIFNPIEKYLKLKFPFPPINFKLERPPHLLIISPRDRIESMREIVLIQEITPEEMESVEAEAGELGVSALVVELGGFGGTYPTFVTNEASLQFTVDAAAEEWLHQYLSFRPLGFLYVLDLTGLRRNYEIAVMNETAASMMGKEIGALVAQAYHSPSGVNGGQPRQPASGFDFNREMREMRETVDRYLAEGEIERAERFMEERRQFIVAQGYYIRKLNQAYFAFYGTYADRPTSINPIGVELRELRSQSASLKEFLEAVASMSNRQDLTERLDKD
jgi:predicted  nucleic acid-binding Zn-ribbon protein